jgi:hypothetical protein
LAFPGKAPGRSFANSCGIVEAGTRAALFEFESSNQLRVVGISGTGYIGLVAELARNSDRAVFHAARSMLHKNARKPELAGLLGGFHTHLWMKKF